ncbi:MAG: translation initiation factor IF-2 [Bacteroidales bacterium]|nr:translation initiation factor IF-2 [Bacteroidales bacterium]
MAEGQKATRLSKAAREFNVGISTIVEFLHKKGFDIIPNPNSKIPPEAYDLLIKEYSSDISVKKESEKLTLKELSRKKETVSLDQPETGLQEAEAEEAEEAEEEVKAEVEEIPPGETKDEAPEKEKEVPAREEKESPPGEEEKAETESTEVQKEKARPGINVVGKIDLEEKKKTKTPDKKDKEKEVAEEEDVKTEEIKEEEKKTASAKEETKEESKEEEAVKEEETIPVEQKDEDGNEDKLIKTRIEKLAGPRVVGRIDLPVEEKKRAQKAKKVDIDSEKDPSKRKRKRIRKEKEKVSLKPSGEDKKDKRKRKTSVRPEINEEDVQKQVKETLARLTSKGKSRGSKYRREKRDAISQKHKEEIEKQEQEKNLISVTEFVSVNELASMMNIPVTDIIETCMNLGLFVSINQRLDAETMSLVAEEFGYEVKFISAELLDAVREEDDEPEDLVPRPPIVTVMGHVDHGKTKLLDHIRNTNVIAGEAGGITQHIGAYSVSLDGGRQITFLDTPGHEAFTAMRARGAQITDIAIIVVAADDGVMPQTVEAINHAAAAGVPIIFAINKIDKPTANPEKIKEELAKMNYLVEDWGGKYQSQEIAAKEGTNIEELLEKVLLEAEMLDLKANPVKKATGTVIESSLDKGRGFITTILVKAGTLRIGDIVLAGSHYGHVKAMYNERGNKISEGGPSSPVLILGLSGAPQAGDNFNVMETDREAKEIANKRTQLQREQGMRTQKHITLDEIGRRIAIGNFQELNIIVKGDVDGSVEALSDALIKLSTEEIQVNIQHKAVGQISESDILLAAASNAIIIGFQVRPSLSARKLAEKEEIDVRLYSIIYDAINEIKSAMEGMLSPEVREEITCTVEVRDVFKITKVGSVAGCFVREGKITRNTKVRVIRDGIVIYTGELGSLKRFRDDVKEVSSGYECGLNIKNFNDIKVGDNIEGYQEVEVKKTL